MRTSGANGPCATSPISSTTAGRELMHTPSALRLHKAAETDFPTRFGHFRIYGFEGRLDDRLEEAVVLEMGDVAHGPVAPLVRIHSQCLTGDVFHSLRCDCRAQLELALHMI